MYFLRWHTVRCSMLHCVLQYVAVCCSVLQLVLLLHLQASSALAIYSLPRWHAVRCSMLHCVAMCCSVLQHVLLSRQQASIPWQYIHFQDGMQGVEVCCGVCCSLLQCVAARIALTSASIECNGNVSTSKVARSALQYVVVQCSVLQCVAVCCSVLQCVALCCSVLQHVLLLHLRASNALAMYPSPLWTSPLSSSGCALQYVAASYSELHKWQWVAVYRRHICM